MKFFRKLMASWFFAGYFPVASGTVGTAAAIPLYVLLVLTLQGLFTGVGFWTAYALLTVSLILFSIWAAGCGEEFWGKQDAGQIVIDEVVGFLVTMFLAPFSFAWIVAGFFAFRLTDIVKPWPASYFDKKVKGGLGVTMDDVVAGIYACLILHLGHRLGGYLGWW